MTEAGKAKVLRGLRAQEAKLQDALRKVQGTISILGKAPKGVRASASGRRMTAAGREAISRAAKARWAAYRAAKAKPTRKKAARR